MEKRFALETRESFLIKNERSTKTSACGRKKKREDIGVPGVDAVLHPFRGLHLICLPPLPLINQMNGDHL